MGSASTDPGTKTICSARSALRLSRAAWIGADFEGLGLCKEFAREDESRTAAILIGEV